MTAEVARGLVEQVLGRYASVITLAMREDIVRLILYVEKEIRKAAPVAETKEDNA